MSDFILLAGVALLLVWAVVVLFFSAPGWIHGLLTLGVFLVIYRTVVRGTPRAGAKR